MERELSINLSKESILKHDIYNLTERVFNFDFVTGLPCGELSSFIERSSQEMESLYIQATNEREAVGISAGAWLSGKKPILYMQNSGLFESSNDIASILLPCKMSIPILVSWRGCPGETATQHRYTGVATMPILDSLGIPYTCELTVNALCELKSKMEINRIPGVILTRREHFNNKVDKTAPIDKHKYSSLKPITIMHDMDSEQLASREEVLETLFRYAEKRDAVISSTGLISRSIYHNYDGANQFYNAGGFGLTSMIGLGFSLNQPNIRTFVIEGDGSVLTNLGSLNMIGHFKPKNLVHVVLDNKVYASCSNEGTVNSEKIPLMAEILGYNNVFLVRSRKGINEIFTRNDECLRQGPTMVHIQINQDGRRDFKRPLEMEKIARRFMANYPKNA